MRSPLAKASSFHTLTKPLLLPGPSSTPAAPTLARCLKWLSVVEMAAKREKGECLNCSEKFSKEHLKTCPMKGVYLRQMDDSPASDAEGTDDPLIPLNTITDLSSTEMMQLHVQVMESMLTGLVDSGSTHSFISVAAGRHLALQPEPWAGLTVVVAYDDRVASDGVCHATQVFIDLEDSSWICS
jgi:hypothetical protein